MRKDIIFLTGICLFIILLYIPLFNVPFVYDDFDFLFHWEAIRDFNHIPQLLSGATPPYHEGVFRPVRGLLYMLSYHFVGTQLFSYHLIELVVYLSCIVLVYCITKHITRNRLMSILTALFFGVFPAHVDNIANLTGSFDTIGILFALISFYIFLQYLVKNRKLYFFLSLSFSILAFYTYEITLSLPFVMILYAHFSKKRQPIFLILSQLLCAFVYLILRTFIFNITSRGTITDQLFQKFLGSFGDIITYLFATILPIPSSPITLDSVQGSLLFSAVQEIPSTISHPHFLLPVISVLGLLILGIYYFKKTSLVGFGILWFFASLIAVMPISFISSTDFQTQILRPRYEFLATFGLSLMISTIIYKLITFKPHSAIKQYFRFLGLVTFIFLFGYYCILTQDYINHWRDFRPSLLTQINNMPEGSAKHNDLAVLKANYGDYAQSIDQLQIALRLNPQNKRAKRNLNKLCNEIIPNSNFPLKNKCKK